MFKFSHTLLATCILTAAAFSNIAVYQCIISGSLCITKTCCVSSIPEDNCCVEEFSCCSEEETCSADLPESAMHQGDCCVEFDLDHDFLDDMIVSSEKDLDFTKSFDDVYVPATNFSCEVSILDIRGSPPTEIVSLSPAKSHIYKLNCSYLC